MTAALACAGISVSYGGLRALADVSLAVAPGEVCGLIGPNGAGKSTLMDALTGRRPAAGTVALDGRDLTRLDVVARRRAGLARSFQRTSVFPDLTVEEQLDLAAGGDAARRMRATAALGLERAGRVRAADLGYGEQRRLDVALALAGPCRALLLDEPAAGLTHAEGLRVAALVRDAARSLGIAVLLVEHDMDVVFGFSDSVTVLELGRILAEGPPAAVRADARVRAAYLGSAAA